MKILRYLLLSSLGFAALCTAGATEYYLTVSGAGSKNGASWANAYDKTSMQTVVYNTMQPGDTLYVGGPDTAGGADYGDTRLVIPSGGTPSARKSLIGVDRGFGLPLFKGPQPVASYTAIKFGDGVGYWTVKNVRIEHREIGIGSVGTGHPGIVLDGIVVRDVSDRCYSIVDCDGIVIQNCRAERYLAMGFMIDHSNDGVTLKNCVADCTGTGEADDPNFKQYASDPVGFNFHIKNSTNPPNTNILLEDCIALNNDENTGESYEQGDGFKTEDNNSGVTLRRCSSHHNQDAGYDLKGVNQQIEDSIAYTNGRYGFKVWRDGLLSNCLSANNGSRQFILPAATTGHTITAEYCTFHSAASAQGGVIIETAGNTAVLNDCIITYGTNAGTYTGGPGTFTLNRTVKLANAANPANPPKYINPVLPWDGNGNDFDNGTYGLTKGYNSGGQEIIVDNSDAAGVTITGSWTASTFDPNYVGVNYLHDGNGGKGSKSIRFTPTIPFSGSYEVFAWWTSGTNRASNTPFDIVHTGGTTTIPKDQRINGAQWVSLGVFSFNAGTSGSVLIRNAVTNGYVIADAIKFVEAPPVEIVVDNSDAIGVTITGAWTSSTSSSGYYGANYLHDGNTAKGSKSIRFTPTIPITGDYEVFTRWTAAAGRATNVPIDIVHSGGTYQRQVNQTANGGQWVSLGVYNFTAGTMGSVLISNTGTNGYVIADAILMVLMP